MDVIEKTISNNAGFEEYLNQVIVSKVEVSEKKKCICVSLTTNYWPTRENHQKYIKWISEQFAVELCLSFNVCCNSDRSIELLFSNNANNEYIFLFLEKLPNIAPWLKDCKWIVEGNKIEIIAPTMLRKQLDRLNAQLEIKCILDKMTGAECTVAIVEDDTKIYSKSPLMKSITTTDEIKIKSNRENTKSTTVRHNNESKSVVFGKRITKLPALISEINEEENNVCCSGVIFEYSERELKTGRILISFFITDLSSSIECKFFCDKENYSSVSKRMKSASGVMVSGNAQHDRYSQELTILVNAINEKSFACRIDTAAQKRIELHLHTQMSNMDGVSQIKELIKLASEMGHTHIAITDHGVVQAFPEAYQFGKKYNVQIIYGMEAYIFDDAIPDNQKPKTYHCILLAKNYTGLKNLYKLTTESHLRYFKRRPRIPKRLVNKAREGIVVGSACEAGELMQYLLHNPEDIEGLKRLSGFYDYIEIQPIENNDFLIRKDLVVNKTDLQNLNQKLYNLGQLVNKPVIATCDVHFVNKEDAIFRSILMASKGFSDAEQQAPLFYRSTSEMLEEFAYLGEEIAHEVVVTNPMKLVEDFETLQPVPDDLHAPEIEGADKEITRLTYEKAHFLYGNPLPEIVEKKIKKELDAIIGNGFAVLYFIAYKLVKKSNEDGYVVGSRGSVGSSVVAYFSGITEVNALPPHYRCPNCQFSEFYEDGSYGAGVDMADKVCPNCMTNLQKDGFDIPFEIFMGFKGDKVPDIDLNFSGDYQANAHDYTEFLFGKDNVFRAGTIATVAEKTAFGYVRKYFEERGETLRAAELTRLRNGCTGTKRTTGQHPGGLMVIPKKIDVHNFTPLQRPADDVKTETVTTHFDYHSIGEQLIKLDILGHDDPTVIKMLGDLTGIDPTKVPLDDQQTMSLFSSTVAINVSPKRLNANIATYGIPEFNTKFTRQMLEETNPTTFAALLRISGFSHGTDVWLNNAQDLIKSGTASVTETISTRDDIMLFLIQKGIAFDVAFQIMEKVRKGKGVSAEHLDHMRSKNIPEWFINSCLKIKYLFPKAHAVAYVMMAYRIAWFKINYPMAFYASYFSVRGADEFDLSTVLKGESEILRKIKTIYAAGKEATAKDKSKVSVLEVALELIVRGFRILPVDIEKSDPMRFMITDDGLLPPLTSITGLGQTIAMNIANARTQKAFISLEDLQKRGKVNDTMIEEMNALNITKHLPPSNQILLF